MELRSPAFFIGSTLPYQFTCDGEGTSPPLRWEAPPSGTQSFALILFDSDLPDEESIFWVLYNLPATCRQLPEAIPNEPKVVKGALQGVNSTGAIGYTGICPATGTHRYFFKLYALDCELDLEAGATYAEFKQAIDGHVLDSDELMVRYARQVTADL